MFSYRPNRGNTGGSGGVNYKLLVANEKYNVIDGLYHYFKPSTPNIEVVNKNKKSKYLFLRQYSVIDIIIKKRQLNSAIEWIKKLSKTNDFKKDDVFVFHDFEAAYAFTKNYPNYNNTIFIYHQQGSLYDEWSASFNIQVKNFKRYLDRSLVNVISKVKMMGFPSEGARKVLKNSSEDLFSVLQGKEYRILYNGVDIAENIEPTSNIIDYVKRIEFSVGPRFITVSSLNHAKAVERIPEYLLSVKLKYPKFVWVIIGNGIKKDDLKSNIDKYGLKDNVIWIDFPIPNTDVLAIFSNTDYYIMMHRWSIFDLSTLEAMGMGNVPILSNVGGNPEVVIDNNGLLIDEKNKNSILEYVNDTYLNINILKNKNKEIQMAHFSMKQMLHSYKKLIDECIRN